MDSVTLLFYNQVAWVACDYYHNCSSLQNLYHLLFKLQVPLPTALPTLVEELEGYSWTTSTVQEESHVLLTVLTMGLVSTTVTTLPMLV